MNDLLPLDYESSKPPQSAWYSAARIVSMTLASLVGLLALACTTIVIVEGFWGGALICGLLGILACLILIVPGKLPQGRSVQIR
jgi:hypothetical protein